MKLQLENNPLITFLQFDKGNKTFVMNTGDYKKKYKPSKSHAVTQPIPTNIKILIPLKE